jgi:hypothetical protein
VTRDVVLPFVGPLLDGRRLHEVALVDMVRFTQSGVLGHSEGAQDLDVDPGFLSCFAHRRLLDGLARIDATARHDGCELDLARNVEDEELVCAGLRVLTGDVDDDVRPNGQLCCARILALWARLAAW